MYYDSSTAFAESGENSEHCTGVIAQSLFAVIVHTSAIRPYAMTPVQRSLNLAADLQFLGKTANRVELQHEAHLASKLITHTPMA